MIEEVVVSNLGLIPRATLRPAEGLTVITGETGAGKTVMLGALRLLMGETTRKGIIGPNGDTADVSAILVGTGEVVVRRVVTSARSKAYLDGALTTASALQGAVGSRIAIVGQHDQLTITSSNSVRSLVDNNLDKGGVSAKRSYADAWETFQSVKAEADLLGSDKRGLERELETLRFQAEEIAGAGFLPGDDAVLDSEVRKLRNAESLAVSVDAALRLLGDEGAAPQIEEATKAIAVAAGMDSELTDLTSRLESVIESVSELSTELARYTSDLAIDTGSLQATEERIALLSSLKRKYGDSLEMVLTFGKDAEQRGRELTNLLKSAEDIATRLDAATELTYTAGTTLRESRRAAAASIAEAATVHLKELGFSDPVVAIDVVPADPSASGADTATVMFASDSSLAVGPVSSIASGGELSRLVLSLTLASGGADAELVAFDEIDAGVGGSTALAMGRKLASLADDRQVICVTHLPQVAAFADRHFVVQREGASATLIEVAESDRIAEVARMLAGLADSEKGQEHAEELLDLARQVR